MGDLRRAGLGAHGAALVLAALVGTCLLSRASAQGSNRTFIVQNDRFVLDGKPIQIISGSIHYFRIHPDQWEDRLLRVKALGLNAVQLYIPWNFHEPYPGEYKWDGPQDVEAFILLCQKLGFLVLLRPGPYICAEWDFGGLPWWLASSAVAGGGTMQIRSDDPNYLAHVDRWWSKLLPRMVPLLWQNGGPIIMAQVENEFGFVGPNEPYLRHITDTARQGLGNEVVLYSTDPPSVITKGTLGGSDGILAVVDFGAGWYDLDDAFGAAKRLNKPGMSPAYCSEFYTGWLSWYGQPMANTSIAKFDTYLAAVLRYADNTGSVNLYMAFGGTNFGWTAGGQVDGGNSSTVAWYQGESEVDTVYSSVITSYDYDAPIGESGAYGQPGIGGPNKFELIRATIQAFTNVTPPDAPPPPRIEAYGEVALTQQGSLLGQVAALVPGVGIYSKTPLPMEEYGQQGGLILYRTSVMPVQLKAGATLYIGGKVHDAAHVLADGVLVGAFQRNGGVSIVLGDAAGAVAAAAGKNNVTLDIIVEGVGRANTGLKYDVKGLTSGLVLLNSLPLVDWRVFPLPLTNVGDLKLPDVSASNASSSAAAAPAGGAAGASAAFQASATPEAACGAEPAATGTATAPSPAIAGPTFYRGYFSINASLADANGKFPDTYINVGKGGWGKGVAFINGFNLGWYWPAIGPQNTLYIPGPVLQGCNNELVLLEVGDTLTANGAKTISLTDIADFSGPPSTSVSGSVESAPKMAAPSAAYYSQKGTYGGHMFTTIN